MTTMLVLCVPALGQQQTPPDMFRDVPRSHWAYGAAEALEAANVPIGHLPFSKRVYFGNDRPLTRYEFAVIIDRLLRSLSKIGAAEPVPVLPVGLKARELNLIRRLTSEFREELQALGTPLAKLDLLLDRLHSRISNGAF